LQYIFSSGQGLVPRDIRNYIGFFSGNKHISTKLQSS